MMNNTTFQSIKAGYRQSIGIRSDELVIACGDNKYGQCDVSDWLDITSISIANAYTSN